MKENEIIKEIENVNCIALSAYDSTKNEMNEALFQIMKLTEQLRFKIIHKGD